MSELVIFT